METGFKPSAPHCLWHSEKAHLLIQLPQVRAGPGRRGWGQSCREGGELLAPCSGAVTQTLRVWGAD